ncbi:MAG: PH domain-containing protein [Actinomycetes bacterium]
MDAVEPLLQVHRPLVARGVAYLWLIAAAYLAVNAVQHGSGRTVAASLLVLAASAAAAYLFGLRPAVCEEVSTVVVRNPLRTTTVPWQAIAEVELTDVVRLRVGTQVVRCYAVARGGAASRMTRRPTGSGLLPLPAARPDPLAPARPAQPRAEQIADRLREQARVLGAAAAAAAPRSAVAGQPAGGALAGSGVATRWAPDAVTVGVLGVVCAVLAGVAR